MPWNRSWKTTNQTCESRKQLVPCKNGLAFGVHYNQNTLEKSAGKYFYSTCSPAELPGGCVQHPLVHWTLPLQWGHSCHPLGTHVCAVHKNLHGTGSTVGTGLGPSETPTAKAREGGRADPSALDFALNNWPGFFLWAWSYPSNLNPQAKGVLPHVTLHFLCAGKESLWMEWPLTGYLPTMLHVVCLWDGFCTCWWPQQFYKKKELSSQWHSKQLCRSHVAIAYNLQKFKFAPMFPNVSQV